MAKGKIIFINNPNKHGKIQQDNTEPPVIHHWNIRKDHKNGNEFDPSIKVGDSVTYTVKGNKKATDVVKTNGPSCDFSATPEIINSGESSELFWTSENATQASLSDGTTSEEAPLNGTKNVSPASTTTYTLTVKDNATGNVAKCSATVTVSTLL
ncbi:MAG: hypothetical protein COA57_02285 [Flavobacteriales bacterium]|nr:MAG: hypothetical protein COA57_02285 [Flavobacteriales bacterium]